MAASPCVAVREPNSEKLAGCGHTHRRTHGWFSGKTFSKGLLCAFVGPAIHSHHTTLFSCFCELQSSRPHTGKQEPSSSVALSVLFTVLPLHCKISLACRGRRKLSMKVWGEKSKTALPEIPAKIPEWQTSLGVQKLHS